MKLVIFDFDGVFINTADPKIAESMKEIVKNFSKNYILAVVSSVSTLTIQKVLTKEHILVHFRDILGFEANISKFTKNKMLLEKYKIAPEEAVYITDTAGDILEARECGIKSIAVTWGFHEEVMLRKAQPEKIVRTPEDLTKAIKEILS